MSPNFQLHRQTRRAFTLIEMLMTLTLFGVAAVALIRTLKTTANMAVESQMDSRMVLRVQSRLTEISKLNDLTPWKDANKVVSDKDDMGVWTETTVEEMKDIKNADGQEVTQLYRVYVKAFYHVDWKAEPEWMDAEVWRYLPLYRSNGGTTGMATPTGGNYDHLALELDVKPSVNARNEVEAEISNISHSTSLPPQRLNLGKVALNEPVRRLGGAP
jgi:prepilin-type N-terminal cleavage/methylation domain-containing protein